MIAILSILAKIVIGIVAMIFLGIMALVCWVCLQGDEGKNPFQ